MKFAFRKIITTPENPVYMNGYHRENKSEGVLQDLEANILMLEFKEGKRWIHLVIDSINVGEDFTEKIQALFSKKFKMSCNDISVSATHTHSGPAYFPLVFDGSTGNQNYVDELYSKIHQGVEGIEDDLQDGSVSISAYEFKGFYGNRNTKDGISDNTSTILEFVNTSTSEKIIYTHISVHPTFYNGSNTSLSPDIIGEIRNQLTTFFNAPSMVCNGTCGDVSTRFYRDGFPTLDSIGKEFYKQLSEQYNPVSINLEHQNNGVYTETITINHENDATNKVLLNQQKNAKTPMGEMFVSRLITRASWGKYDYTLESSWVDFGELLMVFLPGDICSEFGYKIRTSYPKKRVLVVGYSNQYCNYMVPNNDYGLYFETFTSRFHYGQAEQFIDNTIHALLTVNP